MDQRTFAGGRYESQRILGQGGQKVVHLVRDKRLDRTCALALLCGDALRADDDARLENEARALAQAGAHPNVVTIFDMGEEDGRPYIVSEYVPGGDLAAELARAGGPLPLDRALAVARDLLRALIHVHLTGIVHRDLKPSNVWITAEGAPKLGDFGLALRGDCPRLTAAGGIVGTPSYLAPEQIQGGTIDARTDLYAFGCLLHELLAGKPPFHGPVAAVIAQHLHAAPPRLAGEQLPEEVGALVKDLLAKDPSARPQTAVAALGRLEAALDALKRHGTARTAIAGAASRAPLPSTPAPPPRPIICVLPFETLGGSAEPYFADGLAEDVIVALSKFGSLMVIGRSASFRYRGETDLAKLGRELGVELVVSGRVRSSGERVAISIELVSAPDGRVIWAERYDRALADIFAVQSEVVRTIVSTLVNRVEAARLESVRRAPTESLAAYDCVLRGKDHHHRATLEDNRRAQAFFTRAIELDPCYAQAYAWAACAIGQCFGLGGTVPNPEQAQDLLVRAHALDPNESECHRIFAAMNIWMGRIDEAASYQERALALNPNDERIVCQNGELLTYQGRPEEGLDWIRLSMRLNPFHGDGVRSDLARALYVTGRWSEALDVLRRIVSPRTAHHAMMASCHLQLRDRAAAEERGKLLVASQPRFEVGAFISGLHYKRESDRLTLERDLRALGL